MPDYLHLVMPHSHRTPMDRQLMFVVAIWVVVLLDALRQGIGLPASEIVARWPSTFPDDLLWFSIFSPPLLVAANNLTPPNWVQGLWFSWPRRLVDHWLGSGAARRFWQQLRPLALMSAAAFVLGGGGFIASDRAGALPSAFAISKIFIGFGVGFFLGMLLEKYVFKRAHAA